MPKKLKISYLILIIFYVYYNNCWKEPFLSIGNVGIELIFLSFVVSIFTLKQFMIVLGTLGIIFLGSDILNRTLNIPADPGIGLLYYILLWLMWCLFITINILLYKFEKPRIKYKRPKEIKEEKKEIELEIEEKPDFGGILREKIEVQKIEMQKPEIEKELQMKILEIEKLINDMKYNDAISHIEKVKHDAETYRLGDIIKWADKNKLICSTRIIKRNIIDLGTKFTRLEIIEIIEKTSINDEELIINTITEMIKNNEIYADYFSSTKVVAFNQQAIIKDIDSLMKTYEHWEGEKRGKINK